MTLVDVHRKRRGTSWPCERAPLGPTASCLPQEPRSRTVRLLEALSRTGTRKPLVENLLAAQEGKTARVEDGFARTGDPDEDASP